MSLNWARFQLAFQLQKTPYQPDILELTFSRLFWGVKSDKIFSCLIQLILEVRVDIGEDS